MVKSIQSLHSVYTSGPGSSKRKLEILSLSRGLRLEAQAHGAGVNASYFAVHEVLTEAFGADPLATSSIELHAAMSARLRLLLAGRNNQADFAGNP